MVTMYIQLIWLGDAVFTYIDSILYIDKHVNTEILILYTLYLSYIAMN